MSKKNTNKKTPEFFASEKLQPLIDWCASTTYVGGITEIQRRFHAITGEEKPRCEFMRWLNPDKKARVQPRFGVGLVLVQIFEEVSKEMPAGKAAT